MRFRLVEKTQRFDSKYIFSILSDRGYKNSGYLSKNPELKAELEKKLKRKIDTKKYEIHHINGIHPAGNGLNYYNDYSNLALVPVDLHKEITKENVSIVEKFFESSLGNKDVGTAVFGIMTYCYNKDIDPSWYLNTDNIPLDAMTEGVLSAVRDNFIKKYSSRADVVILSSILGGSTDER